MNQNNYFKNNSHDEFYGYDDEYDYEVSNSVNKFVEKFKSIVLLAMQGVIIEFTASLIFNLLKSKDLRKLKIDFSISDYSAIFFSVILSELIVKEDASYSKTIIGVSLESILLSLFESKIENKEFSIDSKQIVSSSILAVIIQYFLEKLGLSEGSDLEQMIIMIIVNTLVEFTGEGNLLI